MADVMLAEKWSDEDPSGWWISEKLDGVRAVWRGGEFVSRGDNKFSCPAWFQSKMPPGCVLDGELWGGRRQFQKTVGIVKSASRAKEWDFLTYMVFDVLADERGVSVERQPFEERLEVIRRICAGAEVLKPVPMQKCTGREHLQELLSAVEHSGGEGLMLRRPRSAYEHRRSKSLLKVKTFHDEEAIVIGHEEGVGRNRGVCGALVCETPDKRRFKVGSGLSDAQRRDPPKTGSVITYRYQELTNANIPRFPTLAGERVDLAWRTICATYTPPGKRLEAALKKKHTVLFGEDAKAGDGAVATSAAAPTAAAASSSAPAEPAPARGLKRALSREDVQQRGAPEQDLEDLFGDAPAMVSGPAMKCRKVDKRPLCPYGLKCYRMNPAHFTEFAHPWLDEENEEFVSKAHVTPPASHAAAAAASTSSTSTPTSTSVGTAVATSAPAGSDAAAPATTRSPSPHRAPIATTASPGSSRDAASPGGSSTDDVRILALRSLLQSLVRDAAPGSEHEHFAQMLALLEAGPARGARGASIAVDAEEEELPPLPPPDDLPPSALPRPSSGAPHELPAAAAEALRHQETQPLETVPADIPDVEPALPEGVIAVPADIPDVEPALPEGVVRADLETLTVMGFPVADATEALLRCGTLDRAVEHLLAKGPR